jgi:coproporphyrinogen III oxidase-like Fe-S oxidoreductase
MNWSPSRSPAALAEDVQRVAAAGAEGLALYNLSLVPEVGLEAIRAATKAYRATLPG